jgi:hypothetical protein
VARHAIVKDRAGAPGPPSASPLAPAGLASAGQPADGPELTDPAPAGLARSGAEPGRDAPRTGSQGRGSRHGARPPAAAAPGRGARWVTALVPRWASARTGPAGPAAWRPFAIHCLSIFGGSMALFLLRFLVPSPVGMADDGDGPRLMCGLGVVPVTGGSERYDGFAFFRYALSPATCAHATQYSSSEHLLLVAAKWLTPVLGLQGAVSLIALGILTCALASAGIAALACGLAPALRSRLVVAGALWLIMADSVWFDTYASPYSEGATLTGLLLVTAGLVYLGRGRLASAAGIALAGAGGYLVVLSKEEYVALIVPVSAGLLLAALARDGRRGIRRLLTGRMAAAVLAAALLLAGAAAFAQRDAASPYTKLLHQEQVVDVIFTDIIPRGITVHDAKDSLHALGLPGSWQKYAGHNFWSKPTVYANPLYARYADRLTDTNLARYLITHPLKTMQVAQSSAVDAMDLRVNYLGSYAPGAQRPPGTLENRVGIVSSIIGVIPTQLGLFWLIPLWAVMLALSVVTLRRPKVASWHHDAAVATIALTGCAMAAFVPAAFFDGIETTRHMLGMNMATALAFAVCFTLLASLLRRGLRQEGAPGRPLAALAQESRVAPQPRAPADLTWPAGEAPADQTLADRAMAGRAMAGRAPAPGRRRRPAHGG